MASTTQKAINRTRRRNQMDEAVSLINKFHSLSNLGLKNDELIFVQNHIKRELKRMKKGLPNWFNNSIPYWIESKDAWFNR